MERLPDEIVLYLLTFLDPTDLTACQRLCRRFCRLAHDNKLWKQACFDWSRAEALRRRQELLAAQGTNLASLREALNLAPPQLLHLPVDRLTATSQTSRDHQWRRARALVNWDPTGPKLKPDWYNEFAQRHGSISLGWLQPVTDGRGDSSEAREAIGMGVLRDADGSASRIVAPLDDGSLGIWSLKSGQGCSAGALIARTAKSALLNRDTTSSKLSNETGAIDNVSIDSVTGKAYIGLADVLVEVDISTLQVVRKQSFPFAINSLSEASQRVPLTVGTTMTLHLYDTRMAARNVDHSTISRIELISGTGYTMQMPSSHVTLSQPGPLSLLHISESNDICVAGRFTSLINYDRRFWPRVKGTIFSGSRLSSLALIEQSYVPRSLDLLRNEEIPTSAMQLARSLPGMSIVAAGVYKGKGSLEQYSLLDDGSPSSLPSDLLPYWKAETSFKNRHTASKSRLLSVSPHGARIVFTDGDGNLKWMERDCYTLVRSFNINEDIPNAQRSHSSLFAANTDHQNGDIVQKVTTTKSDGTGDLLLWTGDGKLGLLNFGPKSSLSSSNADGQQRLSDEDATKAEQEKLYGKHMRRALEVQADEARFVRGLGMPFIA